MVTRQQQNPCLWTPPPSWQIVGTNHAVPDAPEGFSPPKKWWQLRDGTTGTALDAATICATNPWILPRSATVLMTRSTVVFAMDAFGRVKIFIFKY